MRRTVGFAGALLAIALLTPATPAEAQSGVYLKLDSGWAWGKSAGFQEDDPSSPDCFLVVTATPTTTCGGKLNDLGSSFVIGAGVGYRFTPMFRADVTYSHRGGFNLKGWDPAGTYFDPDVTSDAIMVNGFFDMPYKIADRAQPYIGLAIGRSKNKMDALKWNDPGCCSGVLNAGGSHTSTAWQFTLGAAISIAPMWLLDVGYRYSDLGEFKKPAGPDQANNFTGSGSTTSATGKLRTNEILFSLRRDL
jgi:opacity protein-like surface antigen